ncbi:MAG: DUF2065 domain-containing protein [Xanthomonadales bacterium]|nr:DUF2065 domain-containing protein [Gammaproteobacteria bacterium]NNE05112.1 DUF2065 domain-containing protein [Xanthomonadales bacterium]NNL94440.1 DUF2065 domain-containing protein [Xanthomonadales bacterium]
MIQDLLTAFALLLIIEGLLPGIAPAAYLKMLGEVRKFGQRNLRTIGIISMLSGAALLHFLN